MPILLSAEVLHVGSLKKQKQLAASNSPKRAQKQGKKGLRPVGHRSVEWHLGVCLQ